MQVMKKGTHCKIMDELRYLVYHRSKVTSLDALLPTSYLLRGHLLRSFYSVLMQINCLTNPSLEARQAGFENVDGSLAPSTCSRMILLFLVLVLKVQLCDATIERMIFCVVYFANVTVIVTVFNVKILLVSYKVCDFPASL